MTLILTDQGMQLTSPLPGTEYTPSDHQPLPQFAGKFHTIIYLFRVRACMDSTNAKCSTENTTIL